MIMSDFSRTNFRSSLLVLLTRQQNIASRHPRLSGIGQRNTPKAKKDSGQAGMTKFKYLIAGLIVEVWHKVFSQFTWSNAQHRYAMVFANENIDVFSPAHVYTERFIIVKINPNN